MKNSKYWKKRFEILEDSLHQNAIDVFRRNEELFEMANKEIEQQISVWYQRFATNNELSIKDAKKILNANELKELKWDIKEYIKYGRENDINNLWMKELENASAKYHISRLEALKLQTRQTVEALYQNENNLIDTLVKKTYSDGYYHTCYEIQKGFNVGWDIGTVDQRQLQKIISEPWTSDEKIFSDRIWQSKNQLVSELHNELTRTCLLGKSPDSAIKNISKKFQTSKNQAGRLIMTEQAYFQSLSQKDAFNELNVEKFENVATLDSHTSAICQDMDGTVFDMKDYEPGGTAPPFHPYCRTVTVPYFEDEFEMGERAAKDNDGKTYYVPSDMKYSDWKKQYASTTNKQVSKIDNSKNKVNKQIEYLTSNNSLLEVLQSESNKTYNNLSEFEKISLNDYSTGGYDSINAYLSGNYQPEGNMLKLIENEIKSIDESMDKFILNSDIITFRGTKASYYEKYSVNDVFEELVYYSTSLEKQYAEDFAKKYININDDGDMINNSIILEIRVPKGTKSLYIGSNGDYRDEKELLLGRNIKYKVISKNDKYMTLEVIKDE